MKKVVWTNGCFDLLGAHHVFFLEECRKLGDVLVVGLNTDESVKSLKGPSRPIIPFRERKACLEALRCVDLVVPLSDLEPSNWIRMLQPALVAKGFPADKPDTWNNDNMPEHVACKELGIEIHQIRGPNSSTTSLIERICQWN